eukprot:11225588-Lingulodinium_polyedra.AAC.1
MAAAQWGPAALPCGGDSGSIGRQRSRSPPRGQRCPETGDQSGRLDAHAQADVRRWCSGPRGGASRATAARSGLQLPGPPVDALSWPRE